ncbi:AzlD domain-containing protein [Stappia sp.]|uniref:AzlD domain-containing protein n=1 Tax=Stappia sp. TaxID=1870903 RepID=UPI003A9A2A26
MPGELAAWAAILLVGAITLGSRLAGTFLMSRVRMSPKVEHFLDNLSVSVIAALVASLVARGGFREAVAVALASLVMLRWKSAVWAITAGMVVAAAWSYALTG